MTYSAQSDVVATLNAVVTNSIQTLGVPSEGRILLPTGDGIAVALVDLSGIDLHLRLALEMLRLTSDHDSMTSDPMRRFEIRIGINENIDNVVIDVNGRRNVAGAGISMAQRIMDKADGGQVLVGQTVYETLRQREKYLSSFRAFTATGKHGITFPVYQYVSKDHPGLNVTTPSAFVVKKVDAVKLSKFAAYYIAYTVINRDFLLSRNRDAVRDDAATVLLSFLAEDAVDAAETPVHEEPSTKTWRAGLASFEDQYQHYKDLDFWPLVNFADLLQSKHLQPYSEHFETGNFVTTYVFVKRSGIEKLLAEWPQIANKFGIE